MFDFNDADSLPLFDCQVASTVTIADTAPTNTWVKRTDIAVRNNATTGYANLVHDAFRSRTVVPVTANDDDMQTIIERDFTWFAICDVFTNTYQRGLSRRTGTMVRANAPRHIQTGETEFERGADAIIHIGKRNRFSVLADDPIALSVANQIADNFAYKFDAPNPVWATVEQFQAMLDKFTPADLVTAMQARFVTYLQGENLPSDYVNWFCPRTGIVHNIPAGYKALMP